MELYDDMYILQNMDFYVRLVIPFRWLAKIVKTTKGTKSKGHISFYLFVSSQKGVTYVIKSEYCVHLIKFVYVANVALLTNR